MKRFQMKLSTYRLAVQTAAFVGTFMAVPALAHAATLSLSPTSGTHAAGETFEVKVNLDTSSVATSGTDAYIHFDPTVLQVVDSAPGADGVQVLAGSLYSQTSFNSVDNGTGKISFSASKSGGSAGYSGSGTLATITFQAVKGSSGTPVTFDFTSGSTTDSNVISSADSSDLLTAVTNGNYVISGDGGGDDPSASVTPSSNSGGTTNPGGNSGNGTSNVQGTGIDLNGYILATIATLIGAGYFLTRRPKTHRR